MAYSYQEFIGDGVSNNYNIPFTYVKTSEVNVYINGALATDFEFSSASTLTLGVVPANGVIVRIARTTDLETRAVDFVAGAVLSEEDLDTALTQVFNGAQEAVDKTSETIAKSTDGSFDAQSRIVRNVNDPVLGQDAANRQWVIAQTATALTAASNSALVSAGSATTASNEATRAYNEAQRALGFADAVSTQAGNATTSATAAQGAYQDVVNALDAANIPSQVAGRAGEFLQVNENADGYELVASVAAPSFFGLRTVGSEIELTYGRDADFNVADFDTWTMAENITLAVQNNNLVIQL